MTYYTIITDMGRAAEAAALGLGETIKLAEFAVGDGASAPDASQAALQSERFRAPINDLGLDPENPAWATVNCVVPRVTGGWHVREVGLYLDDGTLFAVSSYPETYKPALPDGVGTDLSITLVLEVVNAAAITLEIDPSVVLATRDYADNASAAAVANHVGNSPHLVLATPAEHEAATSDSTATHPQGVAGMIAARAPEIAETAAASAVTNHEATHSHLDAAAVSEKISAEALTPADITLTTGLVVESGSIVPTGQIYRINGIKPGNFGECTGFGQYSDFNTTPDTLGWSYVLGRGNAPPNGSGQGGYRLRVAMAQEHGNYGFEFGLGNPYAGGDARTLFLRHATANNWAGWAPICAEDRIARDQLALTNLRLMLNSAVATGALVAGHQWELTDDLGDFAISNFSLGSDTVPYIQNATEATVGPGGWSAAAGTTFSPAAALSDGTAAEATATGLQAFVGLPGGGASLSGYELTCATTTGFHSSSGTVTVDVLGCPSADPETGAVLHSTTFTESVTATEAEKVFSANFQPTAAYAFFYIRLSFATSVTWHLSAVAWKTSVTMDGSIVSPPFSVAETPFAASLYWLWRPVDGATLADLDVRISRDGGITWAQAQHNAIAIYDDANAWQLVKARGLFAETATGSTVQARITATSSHRHQIGGLSLYTE